MTLKLLHTYNFIMIKNMFSGTITEDFKAGEKLKLRRKQVQSTDSVYFLYISGLTWVPLLAFT